MVFLIAFILIVVLLLLLSAVWPPDSPWSPWWKTYKKAGVAAIRLAKITSKDKVYELGSGDAEFLLLVAKETGASCVGVEIDPFRHIIASLRVRINGLGSYITLKKKSFYHEDISSATVVYMYLIPRVLKKITPKLQKELKKETRIISYKYKMDLPLIKEDNIRKLYMYHV
ncbi:MAG: hypothetical protein KBC00_00900 [Candidatus Levybacteria bacterium]|nr:hypothetical protein [Candidatus Levybacteria bacterium]MBP9814747.1 hypothetical protein [Candidatus Levybacteria bacterium]